MRLLRRAGFSAASRSGVVGNLRRTFFGGGLDIASSSGVDEGTGAGAVVDFDCAASLKGGGGINPCSTAEFRTAGCLGSLTFLLPFLNAKSSTSSVYAFLGFFSPAAPVSPSCSFVLIVVVCAPLPLLFFAGGSSPSAPSCESRALRLFCVPAPFIPIDCNGDRVSTMDIAGPRCQKLSSALYSRAQSPQSGAHRCM